MIFRKREHLLAQIREQAEQIQRLMAELEDAQRKADARPVDAPSPSTTESFSLVSRITSPEVESEADAQVHKTDAEMLDWITKARASIEAFGGYISMGGPSATRDMLAGEGRETPVQDDSDEYYEYDDAEDDVEDDASDQGSVNTSRKVRQTSAPPDRSRLATIPNEAAPFGLMAKLALHSDRVRRVKSKSDLGEEPEEDVGLASTGYFQPSKLARLRVCAVIDVTPAPDIQRSLISEDHQPPHILRNGLISPVEVEKLFKM